VLDELYATRYMRHFYSDEERDRFREHWSHRAHHESGTTSLCPKGGPCRRTAGGTTDLEPVQLAGLRVLSGRTGETSEGIHPDGAASYHVPSSWH